jgi:myo-inositol-1(or 4)-monophosphatase
MALFQPGKDVRMKDYRKIASLLKAIADKIAVDAQPPAAEETVDRLVERVRSISRDARVALGDALAKLDPNIPLSNSEDILDEASGMDVERPYWVYDPIDGAYHFIQGLPLWSSSLALVLGGRAVWAAVYDPALGELFMAAEGQGLTLNGLPASISAKNNLRAAVVGTAVPPVGAASDEVHAQALALYSKLLPEVFVVRQMGAASLQLAYTACGRLDGYLEAGADIYDWIAGALLVREAGGVVADLENAPFNLKSNGIAASNPVLSPAIFSFL